MIIDLDLLKKINDQYGHDTGDLALRHFTSVVSKEKRSTDVFGRLGGEEFGLLMPDTNLQQAKAVADRIFALRDQMFIHVAGDDVRVAFTAGVAESLAGFEIFDDMLRAADRALYRGKNRGRDRYELAQGDLDTRPILK